MQFLPLLKRVFEGFPRWNLCFQLDAHQISTNDFLVKAIDFLRRRRQSVLAHRRQNFVDLLCQSLLSEIVQVINCCNSERLGDDPRAQVVSISHFAVLFAREEANIP